MASNQLKTVRHDYIRYANVWEDAAILLRGLRPEPNRKHLSIASGGDNALMLLTTDPSVVVAVDINRPQLHLCALKKAAIRRFSWEEYLQFAGFESSKRRLKMYQNLKNDLPADAAEFWDKNAAIIQNGIIYGGKFERYFQIFARYVLPLIHSKSTVAQFFVPKNQLERLNFYDHRWNTWRWRALFKVFFSRFTMGQLGRDPEFLKQVDVGVGDYIFQKAERHLTSADAQQNFMLRFNLTGHFGGLLPNYVLPENYERIQANIDKLVLHEGFAESAFAAHGAFDYFNLSNIFEYMDDATFRSVTEGLLRGANPRARFGYWNLMVPRNMATVFPQQLDDDADLSFELTKDDKGFFYNKFIINELKQT